MNLAKSKTIQFGTQEVTLLPDRAAWCSSSKQLFVADLHLGKEASFRAQGISIPDLTEMQLSKLCKLVEATKCEALWVLGDLFHSKLGLRRLNLEHLKVWQDLTSIAQIHLVLGNHDLNAGSLDPAWKIKTWSAPVDHGTIRLAHYPEFESKQPMICGHLHPKFVLKDSHDCITLPCFLLRDNCLVLPAFGSFIDGARIRSEAGDRVFPVSETHVYEIHPQTVVSNRKGETKASP